MTEIVYEVLTEFVFDVQGAINNSTALKSAVDNISSAADGALFSLNRIADFATHSFGLNLSVMGLLGSALTSFEKFSKSRLSFTNIISANLDHLSGGVTDFNDQLTVSDKILKNIAKTAREYSLDENTMVGTSKMLAAMLTPMGLSGKNMGNAVNMARMFEKSAPILGVDTSQSQGELIRMIGGQASMGDTLFRRLASETKPFAQYNSGLQSGSGHRMGPAQQFNSLPAAQRFDMLNRALAQFSSNAKVNAGMADLLSMKLMVLKNQLLGVDGILIPLGQTLNGPIKQALTYASTFLEQYARPAVVKFAQAIKTIGENPERTYATIRQLQRLRDDWPKAIRGAEIFGHVLLANFVLGMPLVRSAIVSVGSALLSMTGIAARLAGIGNLLTFGGAWRALSLGASGAMFGIRALTFVFMRFVAPLGIIMGMLQVLSRAKGYAEAIDAKAIIKQKDNIALTTKQLASSLYRVIAPIDDVVDTLARTFAPLFSYAFWIGQLGDNMDIVTTVADDLSGSIVAVVSVLTGLSVVARQILFTDIPNAVSTSFKNIGEIIFGWGTLAVDRLHSIFDMASSGNLSGALDLAKSPMKLPDLSPNSMMGPKDLLALYHAASDDVIDRNINAINDPNVKDKNTTSHTTNIGSVNIRQDFKENMEPDRIAASFVKTLRDVAINPTQAAGRSFAGAMAR